MVLEPKTVHFIQFQIIKTGIDILSPNDKMALLDNEK